MPVSSGFKWHRQEARMVQFVTALLSSANEIENIPKIQRSTFTSYLKYKINFNGANPSSFHKAFQ